MALTNTFTLSLALILLFSINCTFDTISFFSFFEFCSNFTLFIYCPLFSTVVPSLAVQRPDKCNELAVNLRSVSTYGEFAGTPVTNIGLTTVTGNLGVNPGSAVTGFGPGVVVGGVIEAGTAVAGLAKTDLTTAYNDAAGRACPPISIAGNLGGQTLYPDLYKSTGSAEISSGDLTLDALGNSSAVWVFQIASTLTTASGRKVILAGGANPLNIFWQVGSSATFGSTSVFKGIVMAHVAIAFNTGAALEGRALASTAAVSIDSSSVGFATASSTPATSGVTNTGTTTKASTNTGQTTANTGATTKPATNTGTTNPSGTTPTTTTGGGTTSSASTSSPFFALALVGVLLPLLLA